MPVNASDNIEAVRQSKRRGRQEGSFGDVFILHVQCQHVKIGAKNIECMFNRISVPARKVSLALHCFLQCFSA